VSNNDRSYTYKEIRNCIILCASGLNKLGIGKGDVVANCCGNCAAFPITMVATAACGGILSTCNPTYTKGKKNNHWLLLNFLNFMLYFDGPL